MLPARTSLPCGLFVATFSSLSGLLRQRQSAVGGLVMMYAITPITGTKTMKRNHSALATP